MDAPVESSPSKIRRIITVAAATLRVLLRRETYIKTFRAVDFLMSNEVYTYASATAFNVMIAFFPAVIVVLTVTDHIGGPSLHDTALEAVIEYIPANKDVFMAQINKVTTRFGAMTFLSLAILLFSAVGIFIPVELALNYVWKIPHLRHWFVSQLVSFGLLFLFIALAIFPVSLTWAFKTAIEWALFFLAGTAFLDWVIWFFMKIVTVPFTVVAFAVTYWILPARKMRIEEVLPAAIFAGITFEVGKYIYIFCIPLLKLPDIYGTFAVTVAFITWALFASMVLLMGAYLTHAELLPKWSPIARTREESPKIRE